MLNKLNYFNKLLCFALLCIIICISKNNYINVLIITFPFAYAFLKNNYKLMIFAGISFIIYSLISMNDTLIWPYKIWEIFIYILLLKFVFSEKDRRAFINRTLYKIEKVNSLTKKIFYKNATSNTRFNDFGLRYKHYLKKESSKKANDDLNFTTSLAKIRFYGYNKKRKEYEITNWNKFDSTILCIVVFITVISLLYY